MNVKFVYTLILACFLHLLSYGQGTSKTRISGTIVDAKTGETLIGASITLYTQTPISVLSNSYGYFSLAATEGQYVLEVSYSGYKTDTVKVTLDKNIVNSNLKISLQPNSAELITVVVSSKGRKDYVEKALMGVEKINMTEINKLPVIFGEKDILKSIQLLPGIKTAGEGSAGFNVRGGGVDQNLVLLDEAPVYNASHLLGFFSTFNSDAIKDVNVYKGGMPSQFGGRLSSVVDIKMKDGNAKETKISGGIGLIASRVNIEGPILKDKGSFFVSARRTYADAFLGLIKDTGQGKQTLYFYDINLKASYQIGHKDRLFLSGYFGRDELGIGNTFNVDWGNKTGTLRWNHIFKSNLFVNTSLIYSDYSYQIKVKSGAETFKIFSKIEDLNLKIDFDWFINGENKIRFGVNSIYHTISPGNVKAEANANLRGVEIEDRYSTESANYISHEWKALKNLEIVYGFRLSNFNAIGPGKYFTFNQDGTLKDTIAYRRGKSVADYWNVEPRFSANYQLNSLTSIKIAYNRNVQNLHLITNATSSSPTDLWLPSSNNVKPEIADQISAGFYKNFKNNQYEFSIELYYKWLQNQIDYRDGANTFSNAYIEGELLYGDGRAYGAEFLLKKKTGKLTGWIAYTLSKVEKKINGINDDKYFPARQDRPHDISIVATYSLNEKWTLSSTWVYNTGNAVTFPSGKYRSNGQTVYVYTERNGYRMPDYHRLDLSATYERNKNIQKRFHSSWTFGLYNAYGQENPFTITFRDNKTDPTKTEAVQTTLFTFIPSITWNFKF